jgi:hypothetical protein
MDLNGKDFIHKLNVYAIQVPCIFTLMALGFLLETLIGLPFIIACCLDRWLGRKRKNS